MDLEHANDVRVRIIRGAVFAWEESTPIDYRVEVEVVRFEGNADGETSLIARWSIFGTNRKEGLLTRQLSFSEPAGAQDYEATVSTMSRMLANLSREIAAAIKAIPQRVAGH